MTFLLKDLFKRRMFTFLAVIHLLASLIMVAFILLQDPKGGGAFGLIGSSGTKSLFGSSGANQFLVNVTKWSAIIFAITSICLASLSSQKNTSVIDQFIPDQTSPAPSSGSSAPPADSSAPSDSSNQSVKKTSSNNKQINSKSSQSPQSEEPADSSKNQSTTQSPTQSPTKKSSQQQSPSSRSNQPPSKDSDSNSTSR